MKRLSVAIIIFALLAGCTPGDYQRSADLQVDQLIKDREKQTLGYTPQAKAPIETSAQITQKSYAKLPVTPVPPATQPALELPTGLLDYAKLGPEEWFAPGTLSPKHQPLSVDEANRPTFERLRYGPPSELATRQTFDLFQSIDYAVHHSRDYKSHMEDMYLATLDVTLQRHLFDPIPFASTALNYTGAQHDIGYQSALAITNTAGIKQQLPYGGQVVAQGLVTFVDALEDNVSDGENAQLALTGSIPLLRGAGMVNLEPLIQSERNLVYEVRTFETFRRSFVVNIASQYFNLLTQQTSVQNRRTTYVVAAQLTEQSYAMYAAGRPGFTYLSVQRAQSQQLSAENEIISAEDDYQSALDNFKQTLGMPVDEPLDIAGVALDVTPPDLAQDVTDLALKYRLDLQTASDQIEDARRGVDNAKNSLLPDLNLTGAGTLSNRADSAAHDLDSRTLEYSAGLQMDWPLDRVAERNEYRKALISLERASRNWQDTRDSIVAQVRNDVRSIRSAKAILEIQQRNTEIAQRGLDFAKESLLLGRAEDSRDSVDAQNTLLSAQDSFESAKANYQIQILQFLRDTGTLRIDPRAGSLGLAMDRAAPEARH